MISLTVLSLLDILVEYNFSMSPWSSFDYLLDYSLILIKFLQVYLLGDTFSVLIFMLL